MMSKKSIEIKLSRIRQRDEFAVCLSRAPELPGDKSGIVETRHGVNLSVVAANDDNGSNKEWSWCTLNSDEKEAIGMKLLQINASLDEWFFCSMFKGVSNE